MEKDFVREIADLYSARFHHLAEIGIVKEMSFEIDSKDFEDKYRDLEDVRYATPFKMMFEQLAEVDELPCLYRWEIDYLCCQCYAEQKAQKCRCCFHCYDDLKLMNSN